MAEKSARFKIVALSVMSLGVIVLLMSIPWETRYTADEKLRHLWVKDVAKLRASHTLPKQFSEIREVRVEPLNQRLKKYFEKHSTPDFGINPKGTYRLEILLDIVEEGGVMMQYDLIDQRGNTVWELGRTFNEPIFK